MCACRPCYLLFTERGAGAGKFASVPDRYLFDPDFTISDAQWDQFQIPVKMAFFFVNSVIEQTVAFYPSPAGATESLLPADTWVEVMARQPAVRLPRARRRGAARLPAGRAPTSASWPRSTPATSSWATSG